MTELLTYGERIIKKGRELVLEEKYYLRYTSRFLAPMFNLYSWGRAINENFVSDTIAFLLDINGTHAQKDLFMNSFLNTVRKFYKDIPGSLKLENVSVSREFYTAGWGNIDLLIKFPKNNFVIAIENKIYADEQPDQIPRYYNYLKDNYKDFLLILLSKREFYEYQDEERLIDKKLEEQFLYVNYDDFFPEWLGNNLCEIQSLKVKFFVEDFINWIKKLN